MNTIDTSVIVKLNCKIICIVTFNTRLSFLFPSKVVELFTRYNGQFDGITTRWLLKYDENFLVELEALGYSVKPLVKENFENKLRKVTVSRKFLLFD